ncbi:MAG: phosphatidate cytidylyltransferase [Hyphomicrobiaceae bacterium]
MTASDPKPATGSMRDLLPRLLSGLVLAAVAIGLTWASHWSFAALVLAVSLIVSWEWSRIVRGATNDTIFVIQVVCVSAAAALSVVGLPLLALVMLLVGVILAALQGFGEAGRLSAIGVLYAGLPAIALIWLRAQPALGLQATLYLLLCVWASDTGAYFSGRLVGGPKLMPKVSPSKTWSGFLGAIASSALVGLIFAAAQPLVSMQRCIVTAALIAIVSQAGDLVESSLKRRFGVKDTSSLIPGHGGFMDRVDGLIAAAIFAGILGTWMNVNAPARGLLIGL